MSEVGVPGATHVPGPTAMSVGRGREDVLVGDEIVRHRLATRVVHWLVALFFVLLVFTGLPIWSPVFGWMARLVGGLSVARWFHAWLGLAFAASALVMGALWVSDMVLDEHDRKFRFVEYLRFSADEDPDVGKYNAGQKFFFWSVLVGMVLMLLSGIVLWYPMSFGQGLRVAGIVVHDIGFIIFFCAIVGHIYLGTAAEPGTFRSMTRGTVTRAWARLHHPRWYRDVTTGGKS
jgi:formate dehydrogenase subunit gamma